MPGLVPGIHVFTVPAPKQDVDGRDKPGHDDLGSRQLTQHNT
jgi:2-oxoglutarate/2-oxoacid ferredoxin oxidoreductase subunit beta